MGELSKRVIEIEETLRQAYQEWEVDQILATMSITQIEELALKVKAELQKKKLEKEGRQ